jgi:hypothetical protein
MLALKYGLPVGTVQIVQIVADTGFFINEKGGG